MRICHSRSLKTMADSWPVQVAMLGVLALTMTGCGSNETLVQKVADARKHLQLSENEEALGVLNAEDDSDVPAEHHYLKSITLYRLGRTEAAGSAIARSIEAAPDNAKYKGMELLLRLMAREKEAMDQLLQLNEKYAAVGAVAFFATYGFHAKANLLEKAEKPKAAEYHTTRSRQTLDTAMTLRDEIAEFHPDLFRLAMMQKRYEPAREILDGLLKLDPESPSLMMEKVKVLSLLKEGDEAAVIAKNLYEADGKQEDLAEFFAAVLSQTSGQKEHDVQFKELLRKFARNPQVNSKYAVYLARTARLAIAERHLEEAIAKQPSSEGKEALAFVAVTLPLEGKSADMAEERLRQYRPLLRDPLLVEYFEARILFLRKQYRESITRMLKIVEIARKQGPGSRVMATEALVWIRKILADKLIAQQMQKVMEATKGRQEKLEEAFGIKPEDKAPGKKDPVERKTGEKTLNPNTDSNPPESKTEKLKPASPANDSE